MAVEFDLQAGLDISSLSSVTQAQLMQMVNQIAPLSHIGGIVFTVGTSNAATIAQGVSNSPNVTDNPRYARYIWLNWYGSTGAPTPYYYNATTGNWVSTSVAALSITNSEVSASAAIAVTKLAFGTARYILRTNAAGTALEFVTPASILNSDELAVVKLTSNGGTAAYLKSVGSVSQWVSEATERAAIIAGITGLAPTAITAGANNTLMGTNGAGVVVFDTIDNLLSNLAMNISKIAQSGATAKQSIRWSGSSWVTYTPPFLDRMAATTLTSTELQAGTAAASGSLPSGVNTVSYRIAHGLGGVPRQVQVSLKQTGVPTVGGYATDDEVSVESTWTTTNDRHITVAWDATYIYIMAQVNGGINFATKSDAATIYTATTSDSAVWKFRVTAAL